MQGPGLPIATPPALFRQPIAVRDGQAARHPGRAPFSPTPPRPSPAAAPATMQAATQQAAGGKALAAKASGQRHQSGRLGSALPSSGEPLWGGWGHGSAPQAARGAIAARIASRGPGRPVRRR